MHRCELNRINMATINFTFESRVTRFIQNHWNSTTVLDLLDWPAHETTPVYG